VQLDSIVLPAANLLRLNYAPKETTVQLVQALTLHASIPTRISLGRVHAKAVPLDSSAMPYPSSSARRTSTAHIT